MADKAKVGLIGLGLMGKAMTERWLGAGFEVTGYDVSPEQCEAFQSLGGNAVESPSLAASDGRPLVVSLPNSDISAEVLGQVRDSLTNGQIVIDTTTGHPDQMLAIGERLSEVGVDYLDATVSGSSDHVRRVQATIMVGGKASVVEVARPLMECFSAHFFHVGPIGSGATIKLVTNLVLGLNRAVIAEGLHFAETLGLDASSTLEVLMNSPAYSRMMDTKGPKMVERDYTPQARLSQHLKDVRLMLDLVADLPLTQQHRALLEKAESNGWGDVDNSAVFEAYNDLNRS